MYPFTAAKLANLQKALSLPRLQRYLVLAGGDSELALAFHNWNTDLGSSFHLPLQIFELLFTNSLNDAMTAKFGADWYDSEHGIFNLSGQRQIDAAKDKLVKQGRTPLQPPSVIAELTFGFWHSLLIKRYETPFWRPALYHAFPHASKPFLRQFAYDEIEKVRDLRNRIAHHEPIYQRSLLDDLAHIVTVAGWLCPDTAAWIDHCGEAVRLTLTQKPGAPP